MIRSYAGLKDVNGQAKMVKVAISECEKNIVITMEGGKQLVLEKQDVYNALFGGEEHG